MSEKQLFSEHAEKAVLGGLIISPESVASVAGKLKPDHFYMVRHAWIYKAILELWRANTPVDFLTVTEWLRGQKDGAAYIAQVAAETPSSTHVEVYAELVMKTAMRRNLSALLDDSKQRAGDESVPIDSTLEWVGSRVMQLQTDHTGDTRAACVTSWTSTALG